MRKLLTLGFLVASIVPGKSQEGPEQLVDKAIEHAGGWAAWSATRTVQFRRTIVSFASDGTITDTRVQFVRYVLNPAPRMRMEWEDKGSNVVMINDGHEAWKLVNGEVATSQDDINGARNSTFGSHYVFAMPFKLRDPGTQLAYAGRAQLADGTVAEKLRVTYAQGIGDAGGKHDWTFLIDPASGRLLGTHLLFAPGKYDWTEYFDEKKIGALVLNTRRVGYEADANGKLGPKHSEATYDEIQTNVEFPPDLFKPPP